MRIYISYSLNCLYLSYYANLIHSFQFTFSESFPIEYKRNWTKAMVEQIQIQILIIKY